MGEKMQQYSSLIGRFHIAKETVKEKWGNAKESCGNVNEKDVANGGGGGMKTAANVFKEDVINKINHGDKEYNHLYRYAIN